MLDPAEAEAALREFLDASPEDQEGMLSFVRGNGPERCRQLRVEHEQGIPTADQLERWAEAGNGGGLPRG